MDAAAKETRTLPDGRTIRNVPVGMSDEELFGRLREKGVLPAVAAKETRTLPDGRTIRNVPVGMSDEELFTRLKQRGVLSSPQPETPATPAPASPMKPVATSPSAPQMRAFKGGALPIASHDPRDDLLKGFVNAAASGATFNFADELAGGLSAMTGGSYDKATQDWRNAEREFGSRHPVVSTLGNLAGGVLSGGVAGKALSAAAPALARAIENAAGLQKLGLISATGAASGAVSGAGANEEDRMSGALTGGAVGGVLAPVVAAVPSVGSFLWRNVGQPLWRLGTKGSQQEFDNMMFQAMQSSGMSPLDVSRQRKALGENAVLGYVNPNMRALGEQFAHQPGPSRQAADQLRKLEESGDSRSQSLAAALGKLSKEGGPVRSLDQMRRGIFDAMREMGPEYREMFAQSRVLNTPELRQLASGAQTRKAMRQAANLLSQDVANGEVPQSVARFLMRPDGSIDARAFDPERTGGLPLLALHYLKRGLQGVSDASVDVYGRLTPEGVQALQAANIVKSQINAAFPDYADLTARYADQYSLKRAMELGQKWIKTRPEPDEIARVMANMERPERQAAQQAAQSALRTLIDEAPDPADISKRILNSPASRDRMRAIFGDDSAVQGLKTALSAQGDKKQALRDWLYGSATARRLMMDREQGLTPSALASLAQGRPSQALSEMSRDVLQSNRAKLALNQEAARLLYNPDRAAWAEGLRRMRRAQAEYLRTLAKSAPSASRTLGAGITAGNVAGGTVGQF